MPYKDPQKRKDYGRDYHRKYYDEHREERLEYRKGRREKDNENWRKWNDKKKDGERKEAINSGTVYKSRTMFT